jgi:hypothetical protein
MRVIGSIKGAGPQVISQDFSSDKTAATVDWKKVWDPNTQSGNAIIIARVTNLKIASFLINTSVNGVNHPFSSVIQFL